MAPHRLGLMTHSFWSLIARDYRLHRLADKLQKHGKTLIGDVIQMSPQEIASLTDASETQMRRLEQRFAQADLCLGMKIDGWASGRGISG